MIANLYDKIGKSPHLRGFSISQKPLTLIPYPMKIRF